MTASKLERAEQELRQLETYLEEYARSSLRNEWSRTATIAFTIHGTFRSFRSALARLEQGLAAE